MLSKQTPSGGFFQYNPFAGADIHLFPRDRSTPRVFVLKPEMPDGDIKQASACNGIVQLTRDAAGNVLCYVRGKQTELYSIVYSGKQRKQPFAAH